MKDKYVEQRKVLCLECYKFKKHLKSGQSSLGKCDFGFTEIGPLCKNCVWFTIKKVNYGGGALITDREIDPGSIPQLARFYKTQEKINGAVPIKAEDKEDVDVGLHRSDQ